MTESNTLKTRHPHVEIYTDGACSGNPGPGGWGVILISGQAEKTLCGGASETTNNRMELTAAIKALNALKQTCNVVLFTDSAYVQRGITDWIDNWKSNGWKNAQKKPVVNADLWRELDEARKRHHIKWQWIKGHAGHPLNERADELARAGMQPYRPNE